MKTTYLFFTFLLASTLTISAQTRKVLVSEDTYTQGGETGDEAFGKTNTKELKIMNSDADSKYARTTYLKFEIPKDIEKIDYMTLTIPIRVSNRNKDNPYAIFKMDVYLVEDNNWKEKKLTFNNNLDMGTMISSLDIDTSGDKGFEWQKTFLNCHVISQFLKSKKRRTITLALRNRVFNKTSAILSSKEKSNNSASYLTIN